MATPHVAGAAAILAQQQPDWTGTTIKDALVSTAKTTPDLPVYAQGAGRVDVARASAQPVTGTGVADFGLHTAGATPTTGTRTITYANSGATPADRARRGEAERHHRHRAGARHRRRAGASGRNTGPVLAGPFARSESSRAEAAPPGRASTRAASSAAPSRTSSRYASRSAAEGSSSMRATVRTTRRSCASPLTDKPLR